MKKLTRYILMEHLPPFLGALFVIMFVLVLKFVAQYVGKIFAKGLSFWTIMELLYLNLAWMLALAVPMAVLLATLMTFSRMSGDNEIIAIRSAGISLYRILRPLIIAALLLTGVMYYFNDRILPESNHRARLMMISVSRKRPALSLVEGVFNDFKNLSILTTRVETLDMDQAVEQEPFLKNLEFMTNPANSGEKVDRLHEVIIVDKSSFRYQRTITARYGYLYFDKRIAKLIFVLFDGVVHEAELEHLDEYRQVYYQNNVFYLEGKEFLLEEEQFAARGDREKTIKMLKEDVRRQMEQMEVEKAKIHHDFSSYLTRVRGELIAARDRGSLYTLPESQYIQRTIEMKSKLQASVNMLRREIIQKKERLEIHKRSIEAVRRLISSYEVEIYKKLGIAFASVVFILVGAPLGIRLKKGSLGVSFSLSLIFFVIYWVFLIQGENLADKGYIHPFIAMWAANFLVGSFGIYLTWKTVKEVKEFNWQAMLEKLIRLVIKDFRWKNENT